MGGSGSGLKKDPVETKAGAEVMPAWTYTVIGIFVLALWTLLVLWLFAIVRSGSDRR